MIFFIDKKTQEIHEGSCSDADPLRNTNIIFLGEFPYSEYAVSFAKNQGYKEAELCNKCCEK
ncbi:hypothetical protein [Fusobacterium varium]|uniref:hypothetical protein n=1 Tax=Fusobacterium varium TaxID=856 RepID=UPI0030222EEF